MLALYIKLGFDLMFQKWQTNLSDDV
jgi:hypothetical protein